MKLLKLIFVFTSLSIFGCSPDVIVNYSGESLTPVKYSYLYFKASDVKGIYERVGRVIITAPTTCDPIKLQEKLRKLAESKGANGVIIGEFKTVTHISREINPTWGYLTYDPYYMEGPENMMGPTPGDMFASEDQNPGKMYKYYPTYDFVIKAELISVSK